MAEHVSGEMTSLSEGLAAAFACMWLLGGVGQHVITHIRLFGESLTANITLMWLLTRVNTHVRGEIT